MYVVTGLGETFKPRAKETAKPPPKRPTKPAPKDGWVAKDGHRRFCPIPSGRVMGCDLELRVKVRRAFGEFLREVEDAYGRWMERSTARVLTKKLQNELKQLHQELLNAGALDDDPIILVAGLFYRRSNGTWLVDGSELRQHRRLVDI